MASISGFQWDEAKNALNRTKHEIDFEEATEVFYHPNAIQRSDRNDEERWIVIGESDGRILTVAFTYRDNEIRIISARRASKNEQRTYREKAMGRAKEGQN